MITRFRLGLSMIFPTISSARAPQGEVSEIVVLTALNHGRHAACDGYIVFADSDSDSDIGAARLRFSHFFAFSSTTKTAKVTASRTYLVGEGA